MTPRLEKVFRLYFVLSLTVISFALGVVSEEFDWFPTRLIHDAKASLNDFLVSYNLGDNKWLVPNDLNRAGEIQWKKNQAVRGMTFAVRYAENGFETALLDMRGKQRHRWQVVFSDVWPSAPHLEYQAPDSAIHIHGAYLYSNGDVVFNFEDGNFPLGGGLVKINKDSRVVWKVAENTHHSVHLDADENIWVCAHVLHKEADQRFPNFDPPFYEDFVYKISPSGRVIGRISMLEAIFRANKHGLLFSNATNALTIESVDPLHLNDAETLHPKHADAFELFDPGDILVSFAHINTIAVIDADTEKVKWSMTGPFLRQHDPDFLKDGKIMVFDNRTDNHEGRVFGGSRILIIDPVSRAITWSYAGNDSEPFYTELRGKEQMLPGGNVLITETGKGRVFEVAPDGEIVWQYVNQVKKGFTGMVTQADRIFKNRLTFLE